MYTCTAMLMLSLLFMSSQAVKAIPLTYQCWTPYGYKMGGISETSLSYAEYLLSIHSYGISSDVWWRKRTDHSQNIQQGYTNFSATDDPNGNRIVTGHYDVNIKNPLSPIQKKVFLELHMTPYGSFLLTYRLLFTGKHQTKQSSFQSDEFLEVSMKLSPDNHWQMKVYHELNLIGLAHTTTEQRHFQGTEREQWMMEGYPYRYFLASGHHQLTFSGKMSTQTEQHTLQGSQFMGLSMLFDSAGVAMISGTSFLHREMKSPQQQQFLQESLSGSMTLNPYYFSSQYDLDLEGLVNTQEEQRRLKGYASQGLSMSISPWGAGWGGGHHSLNLLGNVSNVTRQQTLTGQHHDVWSTTSSPFMPPLFLTSRENSITLW